MNRKKEFVLLGVSGAILLTLILFSAFNWHIIKELFGYMINGVDIVKESILDLGIIGVISISVIIIICFFFPVVSSLPVQIASAVSYGLLGGSVHVFCFVDYPVAKLFKLGKISNVPHCVHYGTCQLT